MIGTTLAHFRITAKLGEGGMGEVWRAEDTRLGREVAIKVLPERFTADPERLARFEREARVLASLSHPNIAGIHDVGADGGRHFLVMELAEGETLAERLARGPVPLAEALPIALQVAEALEAAHERGIVHRDLKPANVKVDAEGRVKVLDFGLAKALAPEPGSASAADLAHSPTMTYEATVAGVLLGTAAYMSPEQARGKPADRRSDIWAFGVLLFEMLTAERLFGGATVSDTVAAVLTREPDWAALPRPLPRPLRRLLGRCLERDPRHRLQAMGDARLELEAPAEVEVKLAAHSRPSRAVLLAAGLALLGAGAVAGWRAGRAAAPPPAAPVKVRPLTFSGRDFSPTVSPDGRLVAFTSSRDGQPRIWLLDLASGGEEPLTSGPDDLPRFSPDGSAILFTRGEGRPALYRQSIVGGQVRRLLGDANEGAWAGDGRIGFVRTRPREDGGVVSILGMATAEGRVERELVTLDNLALRNLSFSPDGRWLAAATTPAANNADANHLVVVDTASGEVRRVTPPTSRSLVSGAAWSADSREVLYGASESLVGGLSGGNSLLAWQPIDGGALRPLLWVRHLFAAGSIGSTSVVGAGPGRAVYETVELRESIHEHELGQGGAVGPGRPLTAGSSADRQPVYSPDGRSVIFSSNRGGNLDLWLVAVDSGALRRLTDDPSDDWDPAFTRDGQRVLWSSDRGGNLEIWSAAADGTDARQVSADGRDAENPTATPDGEWIVYSSSNPAGPGVWRVRADGRDASHLHAGNTFVPDLSPDGRWAAFGESRLYAGDTLVRVVEMASGDLADFEIAIPGRSGSWTLGRTRWRPDGRALAFLGVDEAGRPVLYEQDFEPGRDTTATRRVLFDSGAGAFPETFAYSPDGSRLVVSWLEETRSLMLAEGVPGIGGAP